MTKTCDAVRPPVRPSKGRTCRFAGCFDPSRGHSAVDSRRARGAAQRRRLRARTRHLGLVRRERARGRVVVHRQQRRALQLRERVRGPAGRVRSARNQPLRPGAGPDQHASLGGEPGGVPRSVRGVHADRRGRGAAAPVLGLLPLAPLDGARLRGRRRVPVRDPHGRGAVPARRCGTACPSSRHGTAHVWPRRRPTRNGRTRTSSGSGDSGRRTGTASPGRSPHTVAVCGGVCFPEPTRRRS